MVLHSNSHRHVSEASFPVYILLFSLVFLLSGCGSPQWIKYTKLGDQALEQKKPEEAERYYRNALKEVHGDDNPGGKWVTNIDLARLYKDQKRYKEAEIHFQNAVKAQEKKLENTEMVVIPIFPYGATAAPMPHGEIQYRRLSNTVIELADLFLEQSKFDEAELSYTRSLSLVEKHLGKDDKDVVGIKWRLAEIALAKGKLDRSELLVRNSITLGGELSWGEDMLVKQLNLLGVVSYRKEDFSSAENLFRRILGILEEYNLHQVEFAADVNLNLGDTLVQLGKSEEALNFLRRSEEIRQRLREKKLRRGRGHEGEIEKCHQ